MKEKLQTFGKAMLVPIALVALGGLLLGLGGAMTTEVTVTTFGINWDWYKISFFFRIFSVIKALGQSIFSNLSILYAVGVAFSLARNEKGWAAFSAVIGYLAMQATLSTLLSLEGLTALNTTREALMESGLTALEAAKASALYTTELGFFTYRTGVFGGIIIGIMTAYIHQRFYKTKLPMALSFFSGTRTVPILCLLMSGVLGIAFFYIWPFIGNMLSGLAQFVANTGLFGTFIYRAVSESLVPFGLHPLLNVPMRWTELGGSMIVDGELVVGQSAIHLAQLASSSSEKLMVRAFMGGSGIINFAIFPGAALAMYRTARPENKKKIAGLLIPTIIATTIFGITEPILFTFLFIAPWLYFLVYVPMAALGEAAAEFFQVSIFQGNIKDWLPFFLRPEKIHITPYLFLFPIFFVMSYFLFSFFIKKFNVMTPGREADEDSVKLYSKEDYNNKNKKKNDETINEDMAEEPVSLYAAIIAGLGGKENIIDVDNCISRLRVIVQDVDNVVDDQIWKNQLEAMGVIRIDNGVQIIYGPNVASIAVEVRELLGGY